MNGGGPTLSSLKTLTTPERLARMSKGELRDLAAQMGPLLFRYARAYERVAAIIADSDAEMATLRHRLESVENLAATYAPTVGEA